jgi:signal transduction histidine kinase
MKSQKGYIVIILVLAVVILSLLTLSVFFQRTLQMETAEQFNKQQQLLANAEVSNIRDYVTGLEDETLHIAQSIALFHPTKNTDYNFVTNIVFKDGRTIKKRIEVLDLQGAVLFRRGNVHAEGPDEKSIIPLVKSSCPGEASIQQDTRLISILAPICRYDSLMGAVILSVDIQDVAKTFLAPIKSGSRGYAWMMDEKGNLLYHPTQPTMVGRNLYKTDSSCFKCHKSFAVEKKIIEGKGDYYGRHVAPTGEDKVLAFSTADVGTCRWIVAISAPYSEITMSIKRSMNIYAWIIIVIFMATVGTAAMMIVSYRRREKAEERAKYERELEMMHSEKLASLERLTSGITSEIGNPLTSVFSFIRILTDMEEDEFKKETLEAIFFHTNRIAGILKQLSCFSKMPMELKTCKVNTVIEESLSLIQYDKRVQDITIVKDLAPNLPAVTTDGNQLSQVIVNIVLNAADAMPNGGTLTIRSRLKDSSIVIDFEDTGVGIGKENLARIFDPFYTTKEQGTGLGLAVSHSIIKKLKGNLTAESELNKGSRFVITLPMGE